MTDNPAPRSSLKRVRHLLWALIALAVIGAGSFFLLLQHQASQRVSPAGSHGTSFGGPFVLIGANGQPFSSNALAGKPYAIYFGFTRCGDVCPTTLARLVKLRRQAANDQAMRIVFVTIDPAYDGPREVGQYAALFDAPIIGLTGSQSQIEQVKKQYGIFAQPVPHAVMGKQMVHTATVLLFNSSGDFVGTISPDESDADALAKMRQLIS